MPRSLTGRLWDLLFSQRSAIANAALARLTSTLRRAAGRQPSVCAAISVYASQRNSGSQPAFSENLKPKTLAPLSPGRFRSQSVMACVNQREALAEGEGQVVQPPFAVSLCFRTGDEHK